MASPMRSLPAEKPHAAGLPPTDFAQLPLAGESRLFGAHGDAAAAAVTHLGKGQNHLVEYAYGLKLAKLGAGAAVGAFCLVHRRHRHMGHFAPGNGRVEKEMEVGLFHIQVHAQHRSIPNSGQGSGDRGLAGAALATGHGNDHRPARLAAAAISTWSLLNRSTASRTVSPSRFCPTLIPAAERALKALGPT